MVDLLSGNVFSGTYSDGRLSYGVSGEISFQENIIIKQYKSRNGLLLIDEFVAFGVVSPNLATFRSC